MAESRLFSILYFLLEQGQATAPQLAEKLQVSTRTIYRDIDRLSLAGVPVYASQGKGGGIFLLDHFVLDKGLLAPQEKQELLASLQGFQALGAGSEDQLLSKLQGLFQLPREDWLQLDFSDWRQKPEQGDLFASIKEAILQKRVLTFSYLTGQGRRVRRRTHAGE